VGGELERRSWPWLLVSVLGLTAAVIVRSMALTFAIAAAAVVLWLKGARPLRLGYASLLVLAPLVANQLWLAAIAPEYLQSGSPQLAWSVYLGLNQESYGQWNVEDGIWYRGMPLNDRAKALAEGIKQRLRVSPRQLANLFARKFADMWSGEFSGIYWTTEKLGDGKPLPENLRLRMYRLSQAFWLFLLALGAVAWWQHRPFTRPGLALFTLALAGCVVVLLIVEQNARYKFIAFPALLPLAAAIWSDRAARPPTRNSCT